MRRIWLGIQAQSPKRMTMGCRVAGRARRPRTCPALDLAISPTRRQQQSTSGEDHKECGQHAHPHAAGAPLSSSIWPDGGWNDETSLRDRRNESCYYSPLRHGVTRVRFPHTCVSTKTNIQIDLDHERQPVSQGAFQPAKQPCTQQQSSNKGDKWQAVG